jgi:hypothetical protein
MQNDLSVVLSFAPRGTCTTGIPDIETLNIASQGLIIGKPSSENLPSPSLLINDDGRVDDLLGIRSAVTTVDGKADWHCYRYSQ